MAEKIREGGSGSGDFGHSGRTGERGGSGPGNGPLGPRDDVVTKRAAEHHADHEPLAPHEVRLGKRLDAGELPTQEMQPDGSMKTVRWPSADWKSKSSPY